MQHRPLVVKNQIKWEFKNIIMEYNYLHYLIGYVMDHKKFFHDCLEHSQLKGELPSQEKHVQVEWKGTKI
jgi:hypothetical protein